MIICGDFLTEKIPQVDITVTSPPYNLDKQYDNSSDNSPYGDYLSWCGAWLNKLYDITSETGRLCLNVPLDISKGGNIPFGADIIQIAQNCCYWKYKTTIIWNEGNISKGTAWGSWLSASAPNVIAPVELIIIFYKGAWKRNKKGTSTISADDFKHWTKGMWTFNDESAKRIGHPAPFPVELPKRCIELFSYKEDIIFDPFMGSGTTLLAAQNMGRQAIGVDISNEYCKLAERRLQNNNDLLDGAYDNDKD